MLTTQVPSFPRTRLTVPESSPSLSPSASGNRRHSTRPGAKIPLVLDQLDAAVKTVKEHDPMRSRSVQVEAESKKEDEQPKKGIKVKTPRRSEEEESGFSDYNPFQSGSEEAAERERRRRKVITFMSRLADGCSLPWELLKGNLENQDSLNLLPQFSYDALGRVEKTLRPHLKQLEMH